MRIDDRRVNGQVNLEPTEFYYAVILLDGSIGTLIVNSLIQLIRA